MIGRKNVILPTCLALVALVAPAFAAGPEGMYVGASTVVTRVNGQTAADQGVLVCSDSVATAEGGACISWDSLTGSGPFAVTVTDADPTVQAEVAFQVCVDNDGDFECGGTPAIPSCEDDIVFSHFDDGSFSNPLAAPPKAFRSGCPGGFEGYVVFICAGAHDGPSAHEHRVSSGTVVVAPGAGGPSGEYCGAPPSLPGKPYTVAGQVGAGGFVTNPVEHDGACASFPPQPVHTYSAGGNPAVATAQTGTVEYGSATVFDADATDCDGDGDLDFTGDYESGVGGAFFGRDTVGNAQVEATCGYGLNLHVGTEIVLSDLAFATIPATFGVEGGFPSIDPLTGGCVTDGVISPLVDPNDCLVEFFNVIPVDACDPITGGTSADAGVWVFVHERGDDSPSLAGASSGTAAFV